MLTPHLQVLHDLVWVYADSSAEAWLTAFAAPPATGLAEMGVGTTHELKQARGKGLWGAVGAQGCGKTTADWRRMLTARSELCCWRSGRGRLAPGNFHLQPSKC